VGERSDIGWTDDTRNWWRGCKKVSAACLNCLDPETRVMMADGSWRPIKEIAVGDILMGYDETPAPGANRSIQPAVVEAVRETYGPTVSVRTASGRGFTSSPNHLWLSHARPTWRRADHLTLNTRLRAFGDPDDVVDIDSPAYQAGYVAGVTAGDGTMRWTPGQPSAASGGPQAYWRVAVLASDQPILDRLIAYLAAVGISVHLRPFNGGRLQRQPMLKVETRSLGALEVITDLLAEQDDEAWKAGWLAGFLDTDGSVGGGSVRWTQKKPNDYLARAERYVTDLGYRAKVERHAGAAATTTRLHTSNRSERVTFLGKIRPALDRKGARSALDMKLDATTDPVVSIARGPEQRLIDVQTSTGTFIAEGLATHNCYITRTVPFRVAGITWSGDGGIGSSTPITYQLDQMLVPFRQARPRRIFINSLSDTFHEDVPLWMLARGFACMALTPRHHYQLLTKRDARMRRILNDPAFWVLVGRIARTIATEMKARKRPPVAFSETLADGSSVWDGHLWEKPRALANVMLGVTGETQQLADRRIRQLLRTPAAIRYVSVEPMQEEIDLSEHLERECAECQGTGWINDGDGCPMLCDEGQVPEPRLDWVITGGETGARGKVRPVHPEWIRSIRDQCEAAGVAHFFKQWGSWATSWSDGDAWAGRDAEGWIGDDGQFIRLPEVPPEVALANPGVRWYAVWYAGVSSKPAGNDLDGEVIEQHPRPHPRDLALAA
jgi:protein gp37